MNQTVGPLGLQGLGSRAAFILGIGLSVLAFGQLAFDFLPRFGMAPCEGADWLYHASHIAELILIAGGICALREAARHPVIITLAAVILLPATALVVQTLASMHDDRRQVGCEARNLDQAMASCGADPNHYRRGKDRYGYDTATVVAPGTTDAAWTCLSMWAAHKSDISIGVGKRVPGR